MRRASSVAIIGCADDPTGRCPNKRFMKKKRKYFFFYYILKSIDIDMSGDFWRFSEIFGDLNLKISQEISRNLKKSQDISIQLSGMLSILLRYAEI